MVTCLLVGPTGVLTSAAALSWRPTLIALSLTCCLILVTSCRGSAAWAFQSCCVDSKLFCRLFITIMGQPSPSFPSFIEACHHLSSTWLNCDYQVCLALIQFDTHLHCHPWIQVQADQDDPLMVQVWVQYHTQQSDKMSFMPMTSASQVSLAVFCFWSIRASDSDTERMIWILTWPSLDKNFSSLPSALSTFASSSSERMWPLGKVGGSGGLSAVPLTCLTRFLD